MTATTQDQCPMRISARDRGLVDRLQQVGTIELGEISPSLVETFLKVGYPSQVNVSGNIFKEDAERNDVLQRRRGQVERLLHRQLAILVGGSIAQEWVVGKDCYGVELWCALLTVLHKDQPRQLFVWGTLDAISLVDRIYVTDAARFNQKCCTKKYQNKYIEHLLDKHYTEYDASLKHHQDYDNVQYATWEMYCRVTENIESAALHFAALWGNTLNREPMPTGAYLLSEGRSLPPRTVATASQTTKASVQLELF